MLAIAELGISTAVIYNLYKPVAEYDREKIKKYMNFYKICYRIILLIITFLGMMLLPFIKYFVGNVTTTYNIYIIYNFINIIYIYYIFIYNVYCHFSA